MITAVLLLALAQNPTLPPEPLDPPQDTLYTRGALVRWGRVLGTMGAAVGIVALGVATGLLVNASSIDHQRHLLCPANPCTEPAAYDLYARAGTSQNFGVAFLGIGGGLLAAGTLLFVFKGDF
ncbi:MAG: hypothetical protein QM723_31035 [Myxococcaceae bacterium]